MSRSVFYYGFQITTENNLFDFREGVGDELTAEVEIGSYTPTEYCVALKTALDAVGALTYSVAFDRSTREITISANSTFSILTNSGTHEGNTHYDLIGFSMSTDHTGSTSYEGMAAGSQYRPQFHLQEYVGTQDNAQAADATVTKTATGRVEVVSFGVERFMECNIMYATNIDQGSGGPVETDLAGEGALRNFMEHLRTKAPVEFMEDRDNPDLYETFILESTPESQTGVGYKLKEMWDRGHVGYYQTGKLKFRAVEEAL